MNLTPVRVRGKRKTPTTNPPAQLQHTSSSALRKMRRPLATVLAGRAARERCTLEGLPSEILEIILLYSANLSLPRASHLVGAKLSGRGTLLRLFRQGFHDTWAQWFGVPTDPAIFHGPQVKHPKLLVCEGDYVFQTALLDLPWVTIDFILQAQQTWVDKNARGRWYQHCVPGAQDEEPVGHPESGGYGHFDARACFEADYQQALQWSAFQVESIDWGTQDIHPQAQLPVDLLTGPWDDEKQRRLFFLTRGGLRPDREGLPTLPWELKLACIRNAVVDAETPNLLVTNCLFRSWIFQGLPEDVVKKELRGLDRRLEWGGDTSAGRTVLRQVRGALDLFLQWPDYMDG